MAAADRLARSTLPKTWTRRVRSAVLRTICLAQYSLAYVRGWASNASHSRLRCKAELEELKQELALLREEIRIKDARMARIAPLCRPHFPPMERMAILQLRAVRAWSVEQTARVFLVTGATIRCWLSRVDEQGPDALVQLREPVNKFPDFVRYVVARLKMLCPTMGKVQIAQLLARAGLHLGVTTVGRMLRSKSRPAPSSAPDKEQVQRVVTAKYANHVWHVDLTVMPTQAGMWAAWLPFALPQCWPFCWWVALTLDHFSRRMMGFALYKSQPTSQQVRAMLGQTIGAAAVSPKYIICDKGSQFWCDAFKVWCRRRGIRPRYGAVGQYGSLAVLERAILSIKQICGRAVWVRVSGQKVRRELEALVGWFNEHRPHSGIGGRTPNEMYYRRRPANRQPRFEPRSSWPRGSPCARPWALVRGKSGVRVELDVDWYAGRKYLPIVRLRRAG